MRPPKELRGFARVELQSGETRSATIQGPLSANFGGEPLGIEVMIYLKSLPLADVLEFPGVLFGESPAEVVDRMIKQVGGGNIS